MLDKQALLPEAQPLSPVGRQSSFYTLLSEDEPSTEINDLDPSALLPHIHLLYDLDGKPVVDRGLQNFNTPSPFVHANPSNGISERPASLMDLNESQALTQAPNTFEQPAEADSATDATNIIAPVGEGQWTDLEHLRLMMLVEQHGQGKKTDWMLIASMLGTRNNVQCQHHYNNVGKKKGWTEF